LPAEVPEFEGNKLEPAGFEASAAGGAPAGVVDARENIGFAGVDVGAELEGGAREPDVVAVLLPKREFPVLAKRPAAGAEVVVVAGWVCAVLWPPNKGAEFVVAAAPPPPKILDAGLSPEAAGFPNKPPGAGAVVLALLPPPKRPPVDGVVDAPPNKPPAEVVGVLDVPVAEEPPNRLPPAGFCPPC
jgi:hypothetical protein